ncbi:uncharacterized protein LOC121714269 isoform X3 [Alosa sapidissima]|uniref:uncharacterized protein LOC121714269 isoform X3 n=1 Tax=Alosa sapidissima TaxID=34773 RepID=UPI001C0984B6|nr:uncharacterized protein LOC121714269 isoform X3 [Alosa sapidissima]
MISEHITRTTTNKSCSMPNRSSLCGISRDAAFFYYIETSPTKQRLYLAAMHFNENAQRPQRKTAKGKLMYRLVFPKAKRGGYTVKKVKTEPTICYVFNLIRLVFEEIVHDSLRYVDAVQQIPVLQDLLQDSASQTFQGGCCR